MLKRLQDRSAIVTGAARGIGRAIVDAFLASDDASYITGQTVYVEGGRLGLNYTM